MLRRAVFRLMALGILGLGAPSLARANNGEQAVIIKLIELANPKGALSDAHLRRDEQLFALRAHADNSQSELLRYLKQQGATNIRSLWINNSIACTINSSFLSEIASRAEVKEVVPDAIIALAAPKVSATGKPGWNLDLLEAPLMWVLGQKGQGVVVASLDTGVDLQQAAIAGQYRGGTNSWFDPSGQHATPFDAVGHGTQTLSLMVGGVASVGGVPTAIGVAPSAKWIAVKIFDDQGNAPLSAIHAGFQWLLDPDGNPATDDAPDVVSNSWGYSTLVNNCYNEFQSDITRLKAANIIVVAAGGNLGPAAQTSMSPANYANVISVGSTDSTSLLSSFSSRGGSACGGGIYPSLVAPGEFVLVANSTSSGANPNATGYGSGTSYASPQVAGVAALLRGAFPFASASQIEVALTSSASDLGLSGPDNSYGYGFVKANAAYNYLLKNSSVGATPPASGGTTGSGSSSVASTASAQGCTQSENGTSSDSIVIVMLPLMVLFAKNRRQSTLQVPNDVK